MGVYQVLEVHRGEVDAPTYELVPSAEDSLPEDFEAQGRRPAYFGSADIVALAISLEGDNYTPTDVAIADASFERIRPEEVAAESEALLAALRSRDSRASMTILAERLPGMVIEALTLRGRRDHRGSTLRVLQDGVIQVVSAAVGARPDDDVRRALS